MPTRFPLSRRSLLAGASAAALPLGSLHAEGAPFRFGLALPLSGPQALYGSDQILAAQWAVADINKAGGVANGQKLEMLVLDTQADPQVGIQMANRLVNAEHVPAFVTAWSAVAKAVAPIANDSKTVALVVGANSPNVAKLGEYVYTTFPLADVDLTALVGHLYQKMGKRRAAVVFVNDETGVAGAEIYRDAFTKLGGTIVASETYDNKATDFTGAILKARAGQPDTIHIQGQVSDTPQIVAQMRQLGLTQTITSYAAIYNPRFIEALGAAAEGVIVTSLAPDAQDSPKVAEYVERWKKEKGRAPNGLPYTQYLYDAPYLVADVFRAMSKGGMAMTGENFRKAMLQTHTFELPLTGRTDILETHEVKKPVDLMQVQKGAWVRIATIG
jgi:branched-chain amino acid transport system substrate-binding protein